MTNIDGLDVAGRVCEVLRRHLPGLGADERLADDRRLSDLGLTSLRSVDLTLDLEDAFGVMFPDEVLTVDTFSTAGALIEVTGRLVAEQQRNPL